MHESCPADQEHAHARPPQAPVVTRGGRGRAVKAEAAAMEGAALDEWLADALPAALGVGKGVGSPSPPHEVRGAPALPGRGCLGSLLPLVILLPARFGSACETAPDAGSWYPGRAGRSEAASRGGRSAAPAAGGGGAGASGAHAPGAAAAAGAPPGAGCRGGRRVLRAGGRGRRCARRPACLAAGQPRKLHAEFGCRACMPAGEPAMRGFHGRR